MIIFFIRIIISFLTAGIWIAAATLLAERFGSKNRRADCQPAANTLIGLIHRNYLITRWLCKAGCCFKSRSGLRLTRYFCLYFFILLRYNLVISVILSLAAWFILAFISMKIQPVNIFINAAVYRFITISAFFSVENILKIKSVDNSRNIILPDRNLSGVFSPDALCR